VAVNSLNNGQQVKIFPNPSADGRFIIEGIENAKQIKVFDMNGREILNNVVSVNSSNEIKIEAAPGIYLLKLTDGAKHYYEKISIK